MKKQKKSQHLLKESVREKARKYWETRTSLRLPSKKPKFQFSSIITVQPTISTEPIATNESGLEQRIFLSEEESRQILKDAKLFESMMGAGGGTGTGPGNETSRLSTDEVQLYHGGGEDRTAAELNYERTRKVLRVEQDSQLFVPPEPSPLEHVERQYLTFPHRESPDKEGARDMGFEREALAKSRKRMMAMVEGQPGRELTEDMVRSLQDGIYQEIAESAEAAEKAFYKQHKKAIVMSKSQWSNMSNQILFLSPS